MTSSGILLIDKQAWKTSHDVVAEVRRQFRKTKVGHAGTLDPFATGLLLVLIGKATRLQRFFMELPKTYEVLARLGHRSTTGDPEGEIEYTGQYPMEPLTLPTGSIMQRPPAYSAIKVDGERAYKKARRGETVEIPPRAVELYRFEQLSRAGDEARFVVECSAGTYIRSLIAELGDAYCVELRRTAIGPFASAAASPETLLPLRTALQFMSQHEVTDAQAKDLSHGRSIPLHTSVNEDVPICLVTSTEVVAIGRVIENTLRPTIVLADQ